MIAAECDRSAGREAGSADREAWKCDVITSGGHRANLELLVDPADGSYSILRCAAPQGPAELWDTIR